MKVYEPQGNFMLMRIQKDHVDAQMLFEHCIKKGLMIRDCSTFPFLDSRYVRFCTMMPEQNDALMAAFSEKLRN